MHLKHFLTIIVLSFSQISFSYSVEIVVDNTSTGFSYIGDWTVATVSGDKYGADYRYAISTSSLANATAYAIWRPTIPTTTTYQVWIWYPQGGNRPIDAQYYIYHDAGVSCFYTNQTIHGGQWNLLGTFRFSAGTSGYVKLTNYSKQNGKAVMADGVKFSSFQLPPMRSGGEFRAYWADAWGAGLLTATQCSAMIDTARRYNFNAVLPQVRRRGDVAYQSTFENYFGGLSPSNFDALSTLIQYAHDTSGGKPYIEVHAWMVTYLCATVRQATTDTTRHVYYTHPEWFTRSYTGATASGTSMFLDPGVPDVINYLTDVYLDVVKHYEVDGIHYDYVRYDGAEWGYNSIVSTRFHQEYGYAPPTTSSQAGWSTWCQYRRDAVMALVKKVYAHAMEINPNVKVTGALITWSPAPNPNGSGYSSTAPYSDVFQDWQYWMNQHILDASIPMAYFDDDSYPTTFRNWASFAVNSTYGRHAYIGPGVYLNTTTQTVRQIYYCRETAKAHGIVNYSYRATNDGGVSNTAFYQMMSTQFYSTATHTPSMSWKSQPTTGILKGHVYGSATSPVPYYNGRVVYKSRVVARNESTLSAWTTTTDGTGFYAFIDLPPGNYTITAYTPPGYGHSILQSGKPVFAGLVTTVDLDFVTVPVELSRFELSEVFDNENIAVPRDNNY
ncbi:MAG: family 10 glycosylhydrolase [bacterium]|nr:family 10 glycosylhydrolase [bacterium]